MAYEGWIGSMKLYGDMQRRVYNLTASGQVQGLLKVSSVYDVRERSWYRLGLGWTREYEFASNELVGRSFAWPFMGGVAAASWVSSSAGQCQQNSSGGMTTAMPTTSSGPTTPAPGSDAVCLAASYAVPASYAIKLWSAEPETHVLGVESAAGVAAACQGLLGATAELNNGFYVNAFLGERATSDFYMIKDCEMGVTRNTPWCSGGTGPYRYTCWVRNEAVFGDDRRYVAPMERVTSSNGTGCGWQIAAGAGWQAASNASYPTTEREWFQQTGTPSWTGVSVFASGGTGQTYVRSFVGGQIGVDRVDTEPCSVCVANSLRSGPWEAVSKAVASQAESQADVLKQVNSTAEAYTVLGQLLQQARTATDNATQGARGAAAAAPTTMPNAYFGLASGDFYMVRMGC